MIGGRSRELYATQTRPSEAALGRTTKIAQDIKNYSWKKIEQAYFFKLRGVRTGQTLHVYTRPPS